MNTEYVSLNTLLTEIDCKSVIVNVSNNISCSNCILEFKSLDISISDIFIVIKEDSKFSKNCIKIDYQTILHIQKFKNEYVISTDDCEVIIKI